MHTKYRTYKNGVKEHIYSQLYENKYMATSQAWFQHLAKIGICVSHKLYHDLSPEYQFAFLSFHLAEQMKKALLGTAIFSLRKPIQYFLQDYSQKRGSLMP